MFNSIQNIQRSLPPGSFIPIWTNGAPAFLELCAQTPNNPSGGYQLVVMTPTGGFQTLDGTPVPGVGGDIVYVNSTDDAATIESKLETINDEVDPGSPEGVGRIVQLCAGRLTTGPLSISQAQTIRGIKGSSILTLGPGYTLLDQGGGVGAYFTIKNDFLSSGGIAGQGVFEDFEIDASETQNLVSPATIHGLHAPTRAGDAVAHTYRNVTVYNAKDNGINLEGGNDKLVADRLRQEGSLGVGIKISGSDCKAQNIGSVAKGSAMVIDSAAVEMTQFDLWRRSDCNTDPTLQITGASNGCVITSGTVEGQTLFIGKNENAANRYINSQAKFAFVHFKYDSNQSPTSYLEVRSADMVELFGCKFGVSGNSTVTPYDYLIEITNTGGADRDGLVKVIGGGGLCRFIGRVGATNKMVIDAVKHICNKPKNLRFEWGVMGQVEIVPDWACDAVDPAVRTHMRFDGVARNKTDYPFGYLCATVDTGGTLDDGVPTFTLPARAAPFAGYSYAMRFIP